MPSLKVPVLAFATAAALCASCGGSAFSSEGDGGKQGDGGGSGSTSSGGSISGSGGSVSTGGKPGTSTGGSADGGSGGSSGMSTGGTGGGAGTGGIIGMGGTGGAMTMTGGTGGALTDAGGMGNGCTNSTSCSTCCAEGNPSGFDYFREVLFECGCTDPCYDICAATYCDVPTFTDWLPSNECLHCMAESPSTSCPGDVGAQCDTDMTCIQYKACVFDCAAN